MSNSNNNMNTNNEFDIILQPFDSMMELVYENVIQTTLNEMYEKYKEDIVQNKSANNELKELINSNCKYTLSLLSKRYRKRLLQFYNHEGLAYYAYVHMNRLTIAYLEELISNNN